MNEPVLVPVPVTQRVLDALFAGTTAHTRRAYAGDLRRLAGWLEVPDLDALAARLLGSGPGPANELLLRWRATLVELGRSPATINRSLAAVRALVRIARTLGLVGWTVEVRDLRRRSYRDTRGPSQGEVRRLLDAARAYPDAERGARDAAILRLLYDRALRRAEVTGLDLAHVDVPRRQVSVLGKGRLERETLDLPRPTCDAVTLWLTYRGLGPGPLFFGLHGPNRGQRLSGESLRRILLGLSRRAGLERVARPHGLRHAAITAALEATGGDVRSVQAFSRHERIDTLRVYDDARRAPGTKVAALVADELDRGGGQ